MIAESSDPFGPGFTAQMTYYETTYGAKVFAFGAFTPAGAGARAGRHAGAREPVGEARAALSFRLGDVVVAGSQSSSPLLNS